MMAEETGQKKNLWQKWMDLPLVGRILGGIIIGVILALTIPQAGDSLQGLSEFIMLLGKLFTTALKAIAPILVFFLVVSSIMNAKTAGNLKTVIILYLVATTLSAIVAVIACHFFPLTLVWPSTVDVEQSSPGSVGEVFTNVIVGMVSNPVQALADGSFLSILFWAAIIGIALRHANPTTSEFMGDMAHATTTAVRWVINMAPFGILGLVYTSVTEAGLEIFTSYGKVVLLLVGCMLLMTLIVNPIIVAICIRKNPYPLLWRTLKESYITAFFTRSSAANIPVNMELCQKLGLDEESYSVSIPLGATINMGGAAITISVMAMCAANTLGIHVDVAPAILLCIIGALGACGASGVAGGSLLLIPLACSLFGIGNDVAMNVVAIGFIIGVIQDSFETAQNSSTDVLFTATADYMHQLKEGKEIHPGKDAVRA
ncbi:MAG: serine/threonine transporter SstT [Phoenicibacter congonensis]|uniref:Serine/threonine transporter SstT n=1 Tax=Phoenicibacter congonensis TaxID=1944646 RepID=A0AA43RGC3_9ACTN|nr:serine/threonine transporter SstT [Phoenicibacter congonensis]